MSDHITKITIEIGGVIFYISSASKDLVLDKQSIQYYKVPESKCPHYNISINKVSCVDIPSHKPCFSGESENNGIIDYTWKVFTEKKRVVIHVQYHNYENISEVICNIDKCTSRLNIDILVKNKTTKIIKIDPLLHPLGSLFLMYVFLWNKGALIHASGVLDKQKVYIFTGVSGAGKSTMAKIWRQAGAKVLNDDRLVLRVEGQGIKVFNSPMPFYAQHPMRGNLNKIFLLKHSLNNYVTRLKGASAFSRLLSNFIQQLYDEEMVQEHLGVIEKIINNIEVFELGF